MSKRLAWPSGVLFAALLSIACDVKVGEGGLSLDIGGGKVTDEWTRSYTIQSGGHLEIVNVNGPIHASASTGAQVDVHAVREVKARNDQAARDLLQKTEIREDVAPDRVIIQTPEGEGRRGGFGRSQVLVRYDVRVPRGLNVVFRTQNGEVRMENIQGRLTAAATNGGLTGRRLSGSVDGSTVNGVIEIDLESITGDTQLTTVNGGIRLNLSPGVNAELEARVVNGGVIVQDKIPLSAEDRTERRVAGRIGRGARGLSCRPPTAACSWVRAMRSPTSISRPRTHRGPR